MTDKAPVENFNFGLFGNGTKAPFKGYISSLDPTVAGAGVLIGGSQNMQKDLNDNVSVRPGLKRWGLPNAAIAGVTSSYEWYSALGTIYPLRVTEENKLQVESSIADGTTPIWYDLMSGLDSTRFVFDTWWDATLEKDILLFVKFDPNLYAWAGGIAKLVSATINTIVLDRDAALAGYHPTGSVIANGTAYAYAGISGSTLTGVSPDPSAEPADSIVISAIITTADTPSATFENDFIKTIGNQLHVGSYNSRFIYISSQTDYTDYSVPPTRAPGDADLLTLDSAARGITVQKGSTDTSGNAVVSGGLGDWYTVIRSNITVGTTLTEQVTVIRSQSADLATALSHEFIEIVADSIIFLDQNNQLRQFGVVRNIVNPVYPLLSLDVYTELQGRDFSGGHLRAVADQGDTTLYITCPKTGIDYMYQIRQKLDAVGNLTAERLWQPPMVRNVARIAVIEGITYGHSNANPQIYQLWDTNQYSDDSPSDEELPYECHAVFAYLSGAVRTRKMSYDKLYFEGYMTPGTNLYCNNYFEYQGAYNTLQTTVNKETTPGKKVAKFYSGSTNPSPGENSIGTIPVGDGIIPNNPNNPPKFRAMRRITTLQAFEVALDVFSVDLDCNWSLLCLGTNITNVEGQPTDIMA